MKKILTYSLIFLLLVFNTQIINELAAQQFNGFLNSDFSGVLGVRTNPASVAKSPYKFDLNLVNGNFYLGNNIADLVTTEEGMGIIRKETDRDKFFKGNFGLGGLSALLSLSRDRGIALQYRMRALANGSDITPNFVFQFNRFTNPAFFDTSYANETLALSTLAWQEIALTYGGVLKDDGFHRWKMGVTLKAVNPTGHLWADLAGADYTIDGSGQVEFSRLNLNAGYSANLDRYEQFDGTEALAIPPQGLGYSLGGADIGMTYERVAYLPDPKSANGTSLERDITYEFKVSASITDIGTLSFEHGSASFNTLGLDAGAGNINFDNLLDSASSFRQFRDSLDTFLNLEDVNGTYTVSLPTALRLNYDYNFGNNFFLNASGVLDLSWAMPTDYRVSYANSITVTPRYETGQYGIYLPMFYDFAGKTHLGLGARYGPLTVGTHTLGALFASERDSFGFYFSLSLNLLKANSDKPYCFGAGRTGSAFVRKERTPIYKRKKFIFF